MNKVLSILIISLITNFVSAQDTDQDFLNKINAAQSLYYAKDYKNAAVKFCDALNSPKGITASKHMYYNAVCANALASATDSAFSQLEKMLIKTNFNDYQKIALDKNLTSLHNDKRWLPLVKKVKQNQEKMLPNLNEFAAEKLITIKNENFEAMMELTEKGKKYGWYSNEYKVEYEKMNKRDSVNAIKVAELLDKYGWLGSSTVGKEANLSLCVALQNANYTIQKKYLPIMRAAYTKGELNGNSLAIVEDKVLLREGKKQLYGTQVQGNQSDKDYIILPMQDPDNADKRRVEIGLPSLSDFLSSFNTKWNVEQYKKDLPKLEQEYFGSKNFR